MKTGLHGRSALITGAASGIGRATAITLANEGVRVIVADLNEQAGDEVVAQIGASGGSASTPAMISRWRPAGTPSCWPKR